MTFHEKLTGLLRDMNMSAVCRRAGVPVPTMVGLMGRGSFPRISTAVKIAKALGVSLDWLGDDQQGWPPVRIETETAATAHGQAA